jgi:hypothetical protein
VVGFDDLIEDPAGDEEAKDTVFSGETDQNGKDDQVDDPLGVLAVVHGADAGNEAQKGGEAGVWLVGWWWRWRDGAFSRDGATDRIAGSGQFGEQAGLAEDGRANSAGALLAQRLAAVLAKGSSFTIRMVCAVHTKSPSCRYFKTLGVNTTKD